MKFSSVLFRRFADDMRLVAAPTTVPDRCETVNGGGDLSGNVAEAILCDVSRMALLRQLSFSACVAGGDSNGPRA
jgi:hypothetical protein